MKIEELSITANPPFPNSDHPVLYYRGLFSSSEVSPEKFEELFARNGWTQQWRNGVYGFHHFHSTAHEALGFYAGEADIQLGGPQGPVVSVRAGDAVLLPAGTGHCNRGQNALFRCVGAYVSGAQVDLLHGTETEYSAAFTRARNVPVPEYDPVRGTAGPWS